MKQLMILLLLCLGSYSAAVSQVTSQAPQYYYAPPFDDTALIFYGNGGVGFNQQYNLAGIDYKVYNIYYPRNFKYPPKGKISALYILMYQALTYDSSGYYKFYNSKIRMGTTTRDSFSYDSINKRFIVFDDEKELTTVLQGNPYIFDSTTSPILFGFNHKKWLKIPLQVPFMYNPNKNLVIQSFANFDTLHASCIIESIGFYDSLTLNKIRVISVNDTFGKYFYTNYNSSFSIVGSRLSCIGFDLDTTGVSGVEEVYPTQLSLYPNPTKDYLYLSRIPRPNTAYTITDITGRQLLHGLVKDNVISVQALQPGLYLLRIGTEVLRFVKEE